MSISKVLTKENAEQFLEDDESVDLSEFAAIEDVAAEPVGRGSRDSRQGTTVSSCLRCGLGPLAFDPAAPPCV